MALEDGTFKHGGVTFPLAATSAALLDRCDPSIFYALQYYKQMIESYAGGALVAVAAAAGVSDITASVAYSLPDNPESYLTTEQVKFPLLAVYRVGSQNRERTMTFREDVGQWRCAYVMPPMTAGQRELLKPILRAIGRIIESRTEAHGDPHWTSGARVWGPSYANLEEIRVTGEEYGDWGDGGDLTFPSIVMTIECKEREDIVASAYDALAGIDGATDTDDADTTTYSDVANFAATTI